MRAFPNEFKQFTPILHEESADDFENEVLDESFDEEPVSKRQYGDNPFDMPKRDYTFEDEDYKF